MSIDTEKLARLDAEARTDPTSSMDTEWDVEVWMSQRCRQNKARSELERYLSESVPAILALAEEVKVLREVLLSLRDRDDSIGDDARRVLVLGDTA